MLHHGGPLFPAARARPLYRKTKMKKKLTLKVEELRIEEFQMEPAVAGVRGTVRGYTYGPAACGDPSDPVYSNPCYCNEAPITFTCDGGQCG